MVVLVLDVVVVSGVLLVVVVSVVVVEGVLVVVEEDEVVVVSGRLHWSVSRLFRCTAPSLRFLRTVGSTLEGSWSILAVSWATLACAPLHAPWSKLAAVWSSSVWSA